MRKVPESYKEWLGFSGKCRIAGNTATFWGPNEFHSEYVPEGLVAIGELMVMEKWCVFQRMKAFLRAFSRCSNNTLYKPSESVLWFLCRQNSGISIRISRRE